MSNASLATVAECLVNAGNSISERLRQESAGALPPFTSCEEHFDAEIECLRRHGQNELADALAPLRDGGVSTNG